MRRLVRARVVGILALAVLVGCGGSDEEGSAGDEPAAGDQGVAYCPDLGATQGATRAQHRAKAETVVGMSMSQAERLVRPDGCYIEASFVDGEPQAQTRQLDPHRLNVAVRDGKIRRFLGFG